MMWNTAYDHMGGMMMGTQSGMMGNIALTNAEMPVDAATALVDAQQYLDTYLPNATVDETVDTFSGYYTMHILEDGEVTGMLSVNGYTHQVFIHTWHGDFIEMTDDHHN